MIDYLGGLGVAGRKLKEAGLAHWFTPNTGATNETGFSALPGGLCHNHGAFFGIGYLGNWWSSTERTGTSPSSWNFTIHYDSYWANLSYTPKTYGLSVRCVRNLGTEEE